MKCLLYTHFFVVNVNVQIIEMCHKFLTWSSNIRFVLDKNMQVAHSCHLENELAKNTLIPNHKTDKKL